MLKHSKITLNIVIYTSKIKNITIKTVNTIIFKKTILKN